MTGREPFSAEWWDSRVLNQGKIDNRRAADDPQAVARFNWTRWRLIDELLQRYYRETGLEPGFSVGQRELYKVLLWTPNCRRTPQYLGRLCDVGAHGATGEECVWPIGRPLPSFGGGQPEPYEDVLVPTWGEYLKSVIAALGLTASGTPGHEACWHRRGKAVYPLVYRVGLLLRTSDQPAPSDTSEVRMASYPFSSEISDWNASSEERDQVVDLLRGHGEPLDGQPRGIMVRRQGTPWVALRSDGKALTQASSLDFREMWKAGGSESEIAKAIEELAGW